MAPHCVGSVGPGWAAVVDPQRRRVAPHGTPTATQPPRGPTAQWPRERALGPRRCPVARAGAHTNPWCLRVVRVPAPYHPRSSAPVAHRGRGGHPRSWVAAHWHVFVHGHTRTTHIVIPHADGVHPSRRGSAGGTSAQLPAPADAMTDGRERGARCPWRPLRNGPAGGRLAEPFGGQRVAVRRPTRSRTGEAPTKPPKDNVVTRGRKARPATRKDHDHQAQGAAQAPRNKGATHGSGECGCPARQRGQSVGGTQPRCAARPHRHLAGPHARRRWPGRGR